MIIDGKNICHVGLGIPSGDTWLADFAISVLSVIGDLKRTPIPGYDANMVSVMNVKSSILPKQRSDIVDEAVNKQCDYLLWVDSDQVFPGDTARRLIASGKDIIGCNIAMKMVPSLPTARRFSETYPKVGEIVYTDIEKSSGLEKIWRIGFGVTLVKMEVFKKVAKPCFNFSWSEAIGYKGEDWDFCEKAEAQGYEIWLDHDMSKSIYHLGLYNYGHKDIDPSQKNIIIDHAGT